MPRTLRPESPPVVAIVGPTGTGKSDLAESLVGSLPGGQEVRLVNADPFQSYRGLDIGTAKPPAAQRSWYRLVDRFDPSETIDAVAFAALLRWEIDDAHRSGAIPVLVGGSGFYLRALEQPLDPQRILDREAERRLSDSIVRSPVEALRAIGRVDPDLASRLRSGDIYRLTKAWLRLALPIHDDGGIDFESAPDPVRSAATSGHGRSPRGDGVALRMFGLWGEGPTYEARLHARIRRQLDDGWAGEARRIAQRYGADAPALRAIGYRDLLDESAAEDLFLPRILAATRQYAKRQRTWFRKKAVRWFSSPEVARRRLLEYRERRFST